MNHDNYPDSYIRGILNTVKTIAMVGISPKDNRPSYFAFKYLLERGYRMIPVNPGQAGKELLGQKIHAKLADIAEPVDMVDVFRASKHALEVVQETLAMKPRPAVIWMQLGVRDDEAAARAERQPGQPTFLRPVVGHAERVDVDERRRGADREAADLLGGAEIAFEQLQGFVDARAVDRLHVLVAPVILGSGKAGLSLKPIARTGLASFN